MVSKELRKIFATFATLDLSRTVEELLSKSMKKFLATTHFLPLRISEFEKQILTCKVQILV